MGEFRRWYFRVLKKHPIACSLYSLKLDVAEWPLSTVRATPSIAMRLRSKTSSKEMQKAAEELCLMLLKSAIDSRYSDLDRTAMLPQSWSVIESVSGAASPSVKTHIA